MSIAAFPTELLCEIFAAALPTTYDDAKISAHTSPLLVSQVSHEWRHTAISDPRLWSTFGVNITSATHPEHKSLVELFLRRSGSQPLSLSVTTDRFASKRPCDELQLTRSVLLSLYKESVRWKRLSIVLPSCNGHFIELCNHKAPNLTELSLKLGSWSEKEAEPINILLSNAPALSQFTWNNRVSWGSWDVPFDGGLDQLHAPWPTLTTVVLDAWVSLKTTLDILRQCHSITSINLRHFANSPEIHEATTSDTDQYSAPLRLKHLQSLSVYQLTLDTGLGALLDRLDCPSLNQFSFACGFITQVKWPQPSFHAFIERSECQLQTLSLEFTGIQEAALIQVLKQSTKSLTTLDVFDARGDICVGDDLLAMIKCRKTEFGKCATLCPKLRALKLSHVIDCTDGALADVLYSRTFNSIAQHGCSVCVPLLESEITFSKKFFQSNASDLRYLAEKRKG